MTLRKKIFNLHSNLSYVPKKILYIYYKKIHWKLKHITWELILKTDRDFLLIKFSFIFSIVLFDVVIRYYFRKQILIYYEVCIRFNFSLFLNLDFTLLINFNIIYCCIAVYILRVTRVYLYTSNYMTHTITHLTVTHIKLPKCKSFEKKPLLNPLTNYFRRTFIS